MRIAFSLLLASAVALACAGSPPAGAAPDAIADFYRGRQLTVLVGYGPGGSASFYAQALAHHMGRFLPGNPSLVVQHMPGAGGLLAANTLFNSAPRDGSVFAITGRTMAIEPLIGNANAKFDGRKFNWLGTANVETTTCLAWHTSPVKTLQDAMTHELVVGGTGAEGSGLALRFSKAGARVFIGSRDLAKAQDVRGQIRLSAIFGQVMRHPAGLPALLRLARDCRHAARQLAEFLDAYTGTLGGRLISSESDMVAAE